MSNPIQDLMPETPDLNAERLAKLKDLFHDLFTDEGKLDEKQLHALLQNAGAEDKPQTTKETYEFNWFGKANAKDEAFKPTRLTLQYDDKRSFNGENSANVIIEGENLEVLKLLLCGYREQIKCIYIDPPYNTGKDFVYSDKHAIEYREYLEKTGASRDGVRTDANPETSGRYHSDWLSMMYTRLLVAQQLLKKDGVIFISIDDNEVHNLRKVCDEIFGADNFVAQMVVEGAFKNDARQIGVNHEYIVLYAKQRFSIPSDWTVAKEAVEPVLKEVERLKEQYGEDYEPASTDLAAWFQNKKAHPCFSHRRFRYIDKRGAYKEDDPTAPGGRKFDLIHPETKNIIPLRSNRGWAFDQETFNSLVDEGRISFITDESIMVRRYLHETDQMTPQSVIYQPARSASERLNRLMGETAFDFPKDEIVIRRLIEMSTDEDSLVLDFFAGSGTTGHAVSDLNNLDGGKRAYILVQIPEIANTSAENGSKIRKISDMTIARNKKVAEKLPKGQNAGFKVFTLQKSYFPRTEWTPVVGMSEEEKLASLRAYIAEKESQQTFDYDRDKLLTEVLIKEGFKLTYKAVKRADFTDNEVYDVTDGNKQAVVCLDTSLNDKTVRQLRKLIDKKVVVIERALDTTKKWNLHNSLGEKFRAF